MSIGKMTGVSIIGNAALSITWDDGRTLSLDLASRIAGRGALASLREPGAFAEARLSPDGWSLEWASGLDFGAAQLRRWADEQAGETMPLASFRSWLATHGLDLDQAAAALGVPRSTLAAYASGEQPIPKTVMLATEGIDRRAAA